MESDDDDDDRSLAKLLMRMKSYVEYEENVSRLWVESALMARVNSAAN